MLAAPCCGHLNFPCTGPPAVRNCLLKKAVYNVDSMQINTAVAEWQNALFDPAMLDLLVDQCTAYPPLAFLKAMHASLTADGAFLHINTI